MPLPSPLFSNNNALFPDDDRRANVRGTPGRNHVKREEHTHMCEGNEQGAGELFANHYSGERGYSSVSSAIRRTSRGRERIGRARGGRGRHWPRGSACQLDRTARCSAFGGRAERERLEEWRVGGGAAA